ncbi:MAG: hypothetical protein A4E55_00971 [Pelotomaculum sp. PtaU1.Bin035]|nr:MAG: hypothetical protein A4E55_00971 [Pelotomaculum sp. PtaU1.Bin035]
MKLYRNAIILAAVAVLLLVIYLLPAGKNRAGNHPYQNNDGTINLLNIDLDKVNEIDIDNKNNKLVFVKKEDGWALAEPSGIKYDQSVADGLPLSIFYLASVKTIDEKSNDLSEYGLDHPSVISVKTVDGNFNTLKVGNLASAKDGYYVKVNNGGKIYIIDRDKANSILLTKTSVKDKNVLSFNRELRPRMLADDIFSVTMEKGGTTVFSARKNAADGVWSMTSPVKGNIDNDMISPVLNSISKVLAKEFIAENPPDLDRFGLKKPAYSLEFENSTGRKKLLIGDEKEVGNEFYAMVEGVNDIFSLSEAGFDYLDKPLREF